MATLWSFSILHLARADGFGPGPATGCFLASTIRRSAPPSRSRACARRRKPGRAWSSSNTEPRRPAGLRRSTRNPTTLPMSNWRSRLTTLTAWLRSSGKHGRPLFRPTRWIWAMACTRRWSATPTGTRSCWSRSSADGAQSLQTVRTRRQTRCRLFRGGFGLRNRSDCPAGPAFGSRWPGRLISLALLVFGRASNRRLICEPTLHVRAGGAAHARPRALRPRNQNLAETNLLQEDERDRDCPRCEPGREHNAQNQGRRLKVCGPSRKAKRSNSHASRTRWRLLVAHEFHSSQLSPAIRLAQPIAASR